MTTSQKQDLKHYRGDTYTAKVTLWQDAAHTVPADLSAALLEAQIRASTGAAELITSFDLAIAANVVTMTLTPDQATLLPARTVYDLQVDWLADGTFVQTVLAGGLTTDPDVTHLGAVERRARMEAVTND